MEMCAFSTTFNSFLDRIMLSFSWLMYFSLFILYLTNGLLTSL
ncbi:hypothetical protein EG68_07646 [Paragonimus skrjabini miyazakii]|uniref:Uncharacterized protein n=1 Tax=Paragonimus skrjabini miyazakii TaxID=59628 RepID=A0A8S9YX77_9TREM|nr:hypothetical protein EG68_07646 [Paragonimus skrjabini miyazakii]